MLVYQRVDDGINAVIVAMDLEINAESLTTGIFHGYLTDERNGYTLE